MKDSIEFLFFITLPMIILYAIFFVFHLIFDQYWIVAITVVLNGVLIIGCIGTALGFWK